jgi:hypothetical protein
MNQYIITEEKLTTLKFCEDLLTRHEIVKEVRSHHYQSEREKVLDNKLSQHDAFDVLEDWILQEQGKKNIPMKVLKSWLDELHRQMREELRQAGEP